MPPRGRGMTAQRLKVKGVIAPRMKSARGRSRGDFSRRQTRILFARACSLRSSSSYVPHQRPLHSSGYHHHSHKHTHTHSLVPRTYASCNASECFGAAAYTSWRLYLKSFADTSFLIRHPHPYENSSVDHVGWKDVSITMGSSSACTRRTSSPATRNSEQNVLIIADKADNKCKCIRLHAILNSNCRQLLYS